MPREIGFLTLVPRLRPALILASRVLPSTPQKVYPVNQANPKIQPNEFIRLQVLWR